MEIIKLSRSLLSLLWATVLCVCCYVSLYALFTIPKVLRLDWLRLDDVLSILFSWYTYDNNKRWLCWCVFVIETLFSKMLSVAMLSSLSTSYWYAVYDNMNMKHDWTFLFHLNPSIAKSRLCLHVPQKEARS